MTSSSLPKFTAEVTLKTDRNMTDRYSEPLQPTCCEPIPISKLTRQLCHGQSSDSIRTQEARPQTAHPGPTGFQTRARGTKRQAHLLRQSSTRFQKSRNRCSLVCKHGCIMRVSRPTLLALVCWLGAALLEIDNTGYAQKQESRRSMLSSSRSPSCASFRLDTPKR